MATVSFCFSLFIELVFHVCYHVAARRRLHESTGLLCFSICWSTPLLQTTTIVLNRYYRVCHCLQPSWACVYMGCGAGGSCGFWQQAVWDLIRSQRCRKEHHVSHAATAAAQQISKKSSRGSHYNSYSARERGGPPGPPGSATVINALNLP